MMMLMLTVVLSYCSSYLTDLVMSHLVIVEVAAGRESLPADPALVRLLARVDPPVGVEAGAGAEPFLTLRADVGLLAGVGPVMCNVSQCKCSKNTGYFQSQLDQNMISLIKRYPQSWDPQQVEREKER